MSSNDKAYGPANPHPFSKLRTKLIWRRNMTSTGASAQLMVLAASCRCRKSKRLINKTLSGGSKG